MKLSWNLLKTFFADPSLVDQHLDQITQALTMAGLELEVKTFNQPNFTNVVLAKVISCQKHPNADNLSLCSVDIGTETNLNIICGAKNINQAYQNNMLVAVAMVGAVLPEGFEIKARKLRGIESEGMICSIKELGLDTVHNLYLNQLAQEDGIWLVQDYDPKLIGLKLQQYLALPDYILEFKITPNRGDCLSYLGIAREIKLLANHSLGLELHFNDSIDDLLRLYLSYQESMIIYRLHYLLGLENINSFNNPINLQTLSLLTMVIVGEFLNVNSDNALCSQYIAPNDYLTTVNSDNNIYNTLPLSVKYRLARGMALCSQSSRKVILMLLSHFNLSVDTTNLHEDNANNHINSEIILNYHQIINYIGNFISKDQILKILSNIGKVVTTKFDGGDCSDIFSFIPFYYRFDLHTQQDIIEEIVRIYGYDKIESKLPSININPKIDDSGNNLSGFITNLKNKIISLGFCETVSYSFIDADNQKIFASNIELINGIANLHYMRASLLPSLLQTTQYNIKHGFDSLKLFELAQIYQAQDRKTDDYKQPQYLSGLIYGSIYDDNYTVTIGNKNFNNNREADFFDLKKVIQNLIGNNSGLAFRSNQQLINKYPYLVDNSSAEIYNKYDSSNIGYIGRLHPRVSSFYNIKNTVWVFELDVYALYQLSIVINNRFIVHKIDKEPLIVKDLSFILPNQVSYQHLVEKLDCITVDLNILKYQLFDFYQDKEKLPCDHYSLGLRFYFKPNSVKDLANNINAIVKECANIRVKLKDF